MRDGGYELSAGDRIGGYEIVRPLGFGGSGSVYEARRDGAAVALKIMHDQDPSGTGRLRFDREAALVKKLRHPNVVQILDHGHTEHDQAFLVFELVVGRSLAALLRSGRGFDPPRVASIGGQILDALVAAHAMGIVHRDIKPANVMLAAGDCVRVLDFGLAKALFGDASEVATITETGHRLGTPRYMSPEMARGLRAGPPGDVYAVALLVAEMISGKPVISSNVQVDVLLEHASDRPIVLDEAVVRSPFGALLARALAKDPAARPTAMAMRAALGEAIAMQARALALFGIEAPTGGDQEATLLMPAAPETKPAPVWDESAPAAARPASNRGRAMRLAWIVGTLLVAVCALLAALLSWG
jgi:serine/threonine protein kinase